MVTTIALASAIGSLAVVFLINLLITKELVSATERRKLKILEKLLDIGISPLLIVFALIVIVKILEVLR
jgi:hypothetical protein